MTGPSKGRLTMAVAIRLSRKGAKKNPVYHVVAVDQDRRRDGKVLEKLGMYWPKKEENKLELNREAYQAWTAKGAQVSETVGQLVKTLS